MAVSIEKIFANQFPDMVDKSLGALGYSLEFVLVFLIGYIIGYVLSHVVWRILNISELHRFIVRYSTMTTKLWASIATFVSQYLKWLITIFILSGLQEPIIEDLYTFMGQLFWLIVLTVIGLFLGGVAFRVLKDALMHIGLEDELKRHKISNALGGMALSSILAGIVKWYIVLVFVTQGIAKLNLPTLSLFMDNLMAYIPNFVMGLTILIVALLISNFTSVRIRERRVEFAEVMALGVEAVILFFGAVLALPKFGVENVSILEDSFKILMVGISIGLALALGLGLKDAIAAVGKKVEKRM